jgi:prevent-host-death family protein
MDKEIALRDANQQFAKYVRAVDAGESFVITRRGKPVARLVPVEPGKRTLTPEQQAARQRALERMRRGIDMGGARFNRTNFMSAELYKLDTNILIYAVEPAEGWKHQIATTIVDCSIERSCVLTVHPLRDSLP